MDDSRFLEVGSGPLARRIGWRRIDGDGPDLVWLGGLRSDMASTKANHLAAWALARGRAMTRFDYSGHGISGGRFADGTISRWLEETLAVIATSVRAAPILVGSSMGGWLAVLAARRLSGDRNAPAGLVLIAPAADFTECLIWDDLGPAQREAILTGGAWMRPSAYAEEPYPITRQLIEDGRRHLVLGETLALGCPVHILQGMADPDVPWRHAMALVERLASDDVTVTLIKDGDHRLSRTQDLEKLVEAVEAIAATEPQTKAP